MKNSMDLKPLDCNQNARSVELDERLLQLIQKEWAGSEWLPRHDNERQVQPIIHAMLHCAVDAAVRSSVPGTDYIVVSEPAVVKDLEGRVSDEAVLQTIAQNGLIRILLEVKGTNVFPYKFSSGQRVFSQLVQQVALALKSKLWERKLMCGISTRGKWYLFRIIDKTGADGRMQLLIEQNNCIVLSNPNVNSDTVQECIHHLVQYLITNFQ